MKKTLGALLLATGVACSSAPSSTMPFTRPAEAPPTPVSAPARERSSPACRRPTLIGRVAASAVTARAAPTRFARAVATFGRMNEQGSPQVFDLVSKTSGHGGRDWYRALLPVRPNGTTGYIPAAALRVQFTPYRLALDRADFRLTLFEGCRSLRTFQVGLGTGRTPTPRGRFYLASLMKPPDPTTVYGAYAYGLSAYSDVLVHWRAGGIIGLHGTNDPSSIGRRSSHGCIRMRNADISRLVRILPLGTPISIH